MKKILILLIIALVFTTCGELEYGALETNEQTTFIQANPDEPITIIINPNTQVDEWIWMIDGIPQNETSNKFTTKLNNTENRKISVYGTNEFENTTTLNWVITPKDSPSTIYSSDNRSLTVFGFISIIGLIILAAKLKIKQG